MKISLSLALLLFGCSILSYGQSLRSQLERPLYNTSQHQLTLARSPSLAMQQDTTESAEDEFPSPKSVMYKSMIIPGWGQITNKQIWKVPIVYGLLGGLAWYSIDLTKRYHDYRAAYYNTHTDDQRFGPTPDYIPGDANAEELRSIRNTYRNRRDMVYIGLGLAYGLNILDAYVFAHMRSFDVSEDLSMRPSITPNVMAQSSVGVTLKLELFQKSK